MNQDDIAVEFSGLNDPIWQAILLDKLKVYVEPMKAWWSGIETLTVTDTGIYPVDNVSVPGMYFRFTRTAVRSPIKGVQAFPFIVAAALQLKNIQGGSTKMIQRVLADPLEYEGFMLYEIHNLPSTFNQGQLIAFVPVDIYTDSQQLGAWVYLTKTELSGLVKHKVHATLYAKAVLKA